MKKLLCILLCAALLLACTACGTPRPAPAEEAAPAETGEREPTDAPADGDDAAPTDGAPTDDPPPADDAVPADDPAPAIRELTSGTGQYTATDAAVLPAASEMQDFALRLLQRTEGENPVVSPLSAWFALAMAADGADGETAEEFSALLGMDREELGHAVSLLATLLARAERNGGVLRAANSAWVDGSAEIREEYLDDLTQWFNAQLFSGKLSSREALEAINAWVSEKTEGLIPQLFDEPLDPTNALVLINTLYMKAKWADPFDPNATHEQEFRTEKGVVTVPFMGKTAYMDYLSGEGFAGVALPYSDGNLCFVALQPRGGTARELLDSLTVERFGAAWQERGNVRVSLMLPKFSLDYTMEMNAALRDMGLVSAFTPTADFSRMGTGANGDPLYIGRVLQKVKVIVDEEGTEAAAATAIEMRAGAAMMPDQPIPLALDEPFVYVIADTASGAVLFAGVLDDPS